MKRAVILLLALLSLSSCGQDVATTTEKDLFSLWKRDPDQVPLEMTGGVFDQVIPLTTAVAGGGACKCLLKLTGEQASGTYSLYGCHYDSRGSGVSDPNCALMDGNGTYTKTALELSVCDNSGCETYK